MLVPSPKDDLPDPEVLDDVELDVVETGDDPNDFEDEPDDPDDPDDPEDVEEPQDPAEPDEPEEPPVDARRSRPDRRIQTLANSVKAKDKEIRDLNARVDEMLRGMTQTRQPQGESQEQRAARRSLQSEAENLAEDQREASARHDREMRALAWQLNETSDKNSFEARCARDEYYRKWAPKVEEELTKLRSQGQNIDRQRMFWYLLGKAVDEARNNPENRQARRAAAKRVKAATTRPASNSRSDTAPAGRQRSTSLEKRLENLVI